MIGYLNYPRHANFIAIDWAKTDRGAQRTFLKAQGIYHPSVDGWKKVAQDWEEKNENKDYIEYLKAQLAAGFGASTFYALEKPDIIFAAGGARSSFHSLRDDLYTTWKASGNLVTEAAIASFPLKNTNWFKIKESEQQLKTKITALDTFTTALKKKRKHVQSWYQAKFVPLGVYFDTQNQIWIENAWFMNKLEKNWATLEPLLFQRTAPDTAWTLQNLKDRKILPQYHLNTDLAINTGYFGTKGLASLGNAGLKKFLEDYLFDDEDMASLKAQGVGVEWGSGKIKSFMIGNRMVPKEDMVLTVDGMKIIFVGDAFHESIFLGGQGLQTHFMEIFGPKPDLSQSLMAWLDSFNGPLLDAWQTGAYNDGEAYCGKWGRQLASDA